MTFEANIARLVTGDATSRDIPGIALQALEEGLSSPSLYILAGLSENENGYVIDQYFQGTLHELGIKQPEIRTAALQLGLAIAKEVIEGKRAALAGLEDINRKCLSVCPFFQESKKYSYDSIGLEAVYGLFCEFEDLQNPLAQYHHTGKTKAQLEQELTECLIIELKSWVQFMNDTLIQ